MSQLRIHRTDGAASHQRGNGSGLSESASRTAHSYRHRVSDIEFMAGQRRWLLPSSACCAALAVGAVVTVATRVWALRADNAAFVITIGVVLGSLSSLYLNAALGKTVLTKTGFSTSSLIYRRAGRWDQIQRVETKTYRGRGGSSTWIMLHPATGKPIRLRAPFSTKLVTGDQQFADALADIKARIK